MQLRARGPYQLPYSTLPCWQFCRRSDFPTAYVAPNSFDGQPEAGAPCGRAIQIPAPLPLDFTRKEHVGFWEARARADRYLSIGGRDSAGRLTSAVGKAPFSHRHSAPLPLLPNERDLLADGQSPHISE